MARQKKKSTRELYEKKITLGYRPDGKLNRISIYGRTQAELDENVRKAKNRVELGLDARETRMTLNNWLDKWELINPPTGGYQNRQRRQRAISHIRKALGCMPIIEIKSSDIQVFYNSLNKYVDMCKRISGLLFHVFEAAIDDNILIKNPAKNAKITPQKSDKVKALTRAEVEVLMNCGLNAKQLCYCAFSLYAGLRPGEATAFTKSDAEKMLKTNQIDVYKVISQDPETGGAIIKPFPKTEAGIRTIPLKNELKQYLYNYLHSDLCKDEIYLFTHNDKLISHDAQQTIWDSIKRKFIKSYKEQYKTLENLNITYYQLRHTFITRMFYEGIDIKTAQYIAGHEDPKLILEVYTDLEEENERNKKIREKWGLNKESC